MRLAQSLRISAVAALISVVPFLAVMAADIVPHKGHYIHFSKLEALTLLFVVAGILWLMHVTLLAIAHRLTQHRLWLFPVLAVSGFSVVATLLFDEWWRQMFDPPMWNGGGYWIVVTGCIATAIAFWLLRRAARYPANTPSSNSPNTIVEA